MFANFPQKKNISINCVNGNKKLVLSKLAQLSSKKLKYLATSHYYILTNNFSLWTLKLRKDPNGSYLFSFRVITPCIALFIKLFQA